MRILRNMAYRGVYYLGVRLNLWPGPQHYSLKQLNLKPTDFNQHISAVALKLQKQGYEAYIVGGSIRDLLLKKGIKPKDFDIVTSALPHQVKQCFARSRIIGKRFRIVHVPAGREIVEVSTFRGTATWLSKFFSARYRNNIYGTFEQDVWRRDFTCNALYYNVKQGQVVDFTGGVSDIKQKKLVVIGNSADRFRDDPVRLLRALRFLAKTHFNIDQECENEINSQKMLLRSVSKDRLLLEVTKLFNQGHAHASFQALMKYGYLQILFSGYERLAIPMAQHDRYFSSVFKDIDQKYHRKERLSTSFLFAALLWPVFETHRKKLKKITAYSVKKVIHRVLKFESRYVAIPSKLQDAIQDIWLLQHAFETKKSPFSEDRYRQPRFQNAYLLFSIRAKYLETLAEKAMMWQSEIEQASSRKTTSESDAGK